MSPGAGVRVRPRVVWAALAIAFFAERPGCALEESGLSLARAMELAAQRGPAALQADQQVIQAAERLRQARSFGLPAVEAEAGATRQTRNLESFGVPLPASSGPVVGPINAVDARARITQSLFNLSLVRRLQAARIASELSAAEAQKIRQDVSALAGALFVDAVRAEQSASLAGVLMKISRRYYLIVRGRVALGAATEVELAEARSRLSAAHASYRILKTRQRQSLADLKAAIDWPKDRPVRLIGLDSAETDRPLPRSGTGSISRDEHPEILAARTKLRLAEAAAKAEKADSLPSVRTTGDYGANGKDLSAVEPVYSYGATISWPLWEGGRQGAEAAEAESRAAESRIAASDVERKVSDRMNAAEWKWRDTRALLRAKTDELNKWSLRIKADAAGYRQGSLSLWEWLEAEAGFLRARDEWREALAARWAARIERAHAFGRMPALD